MQTLAQQEHQRNSYQQKSDPGAGLIAEWPINQRENARVSIERYKGVWLLDCRKWFEAEDGQLRPGKSGIALAIRHLPCFAEAINKAVSIAREHGLLGGQQ